MNHNDPTVKSLEWCLVRGIIPKWLQVSANFNLVSYYNSARMLIIILWLLSSIVYRDTTTKDWLLFISYLQIMQCIAKHLNFLHKICAAAQAEKVMTDYKLDEARRAWRIDVDQMAQLLWEKEAKWGGIAGWWWYFLVFPYIGSHNPIWLVFFRGVETTNYRLFFAPSLPGELRDCT